MPKDSDLSEYEQLRLENIRRNAEFLAQLGFSTVEKKAEEKKAVDESVRQKKKEQRESRKSLRDEPVEPLRKSRRLSEKQGVSMAEVSSEDDESVQDKAEFYSIMPQVCVPHPNLFHDMSDCDVATCRRSLNNAGIRPAGRPRVPSIRFYAQVAPAARSRTPD